MASSSVSLRGAILQRPHLTPRPAARRAFTTRRRAVPAKISCIGWDPEGILGAPQGGHIARLEFRRRLERDSEAREAFERQVREEKESRRNEREARVIPDTDAGLVEFFLDTDAREIEIEIGRLRPRLSQDFFGHISREIAQIKFAVTRTAEMEDRLIELEAMQKVLLEGVEAYDKLQKDLVTAKERLMKILQSSDRKSTLLEMVERNELNISILTLLDENIASAKTSNQDEAAAFMEDDILRMWKSELFPPVCMSRSESRAQNEASRVNEPGSPTRESWAGMEEVSRPSPTASGVSLRDSCKRLYE